MFEFNERIIFQNKDIDILTIGELLVDMIAEDYGDNFECSTYNRYFGGSPANIAINTKRLGINSIVAACVGSDGLGKFLINSLIDVGIDTSCVAVTRNSTSMVLVTKSKASPIPIFYRDADYHLSYNEKLDNALKNCKIMHFSCWPISKEPSRSTIERAIEEAKDNGALVCFDPNYHEMLWDKNEDGVEYVKSLIGKVDIVKPSEDDAERIFGKDSNENQIKKFLDLGVKLVIMTLGKDGAIVTNGVETIVMDTLASQVVDTTGAGDAFWSGFYAAIINGYTLKEALKLGFAVSAYKLKYTGAVVNLPKLEEIKRIYGL
ncbi:carbohydrate kinase family protein [Clostridium sp.]|uniref:carbohydrate kinase family protein n=1 Tax=Clostridium sp. TaxID=1506 RepID=UPI003D6CF104